MSWARPLPQIQRAEPCGYLWERVPAKGKPQLRYLTMTLPFIIEMWPGKVQKKL
jgi:hypothetical protein